MLLPLPYGTCRPQDVGGPASAGISVQRPAGSQVTSSAASGGTIPARQRIPDGISSPRAANTTAKARNGDDAPTTNPAAHPVLPARLLATATVMASTTITSTVTNVC